MLSRAVAGVVGGLAAASPGVGQAIDTAGALGGLREVRAACLADDGKLWGRSLCGPIALVSRRSRLVVANDTVPGRPWVPLGDAYLTTLPEDQGIANTSFDWDGRRWTMVMLPLPDDRFDRVALLLHEVFHREQEPLGLQARDALNNQLDTRVGRTWLRLEDRALARALVALDSAPSDVRHHVEAAMLFRAYRQALFPGSDSLEASLEMQEGLPEYNGERFAMQLTGLTPSRVAQSVGYRERLGTYTRGFAYGTGPAIGVLLDHFRPDWRTVIRARRDPAGLLAEAIGFRAPADLRGAALKRAKAYGWAWVDSVEAALETARAPQMRLYKARLVDGPVITLVQSRDSMAYGFNPNNLVGYDLNHTVYPTGSFAATWGSLAIDSCGALVRNDMQVIRVEASPGPTPNGRKIAGRGWTLNLNAGWIVAPDPARTGSYVVRRAE
jgi:hypothetical protein